MKKNKSEIRNVEEEVYLSDDMLTSLVESLEEKGILTQKEWEKKIDNRVDTKHPQPLENQKSNYLSSFSIGQFVAHSSPQVTISLKIERVHFLFV